MERITSVLHVSLALLVASAGAIFGLAEGRSGIPLLTVPAACVTWLLIDRSRTWRPPAVLPSLLAVAAFAAAGLELMLNDIEAPLLAGGHLLTYLTIIYLLQEKQPRQIWWLAVFSLLQVAVASLLTYDAWFGMAIGGFLLLMLWTLAVFQLHATVQAADRSAARLLVRPAVVTTPALRRELWLAQSQSAPAAHVEEQLSGLARPFCSLVLSGTVLSLLLAAAFFLMIPRVWSEAAPLYFEGGRPIGDSPPRTGFSTQISLGHTGTLQESPRVALEARLFEKPTDQPVDWRWWFETMEGAVRFRGTVQEIYESGAWRRWDGAEASVFRLDDLLPGAVGTHRLELRVFHDGPPDRSQIVFSTGITTRGIAVQSRRRMEVEPSGWTVLASRRRSPEDVDARRRDEPATDYHLDIALADLPFPNSYGVNFGSVHFNGRFHRFYLATTKMLSPELRTGLKRWLLQHPVLNEKFDSDYALARRWEQWFLETSELTYSLNLSVADPSVDPLIDFLNNTRRGHCEYFATALALLLRTQGIPTRVVSGFKGGQILEDGRLVVRDLHAHLWLEAYVEDAPENPRTGQFGPRWITLDPTPAARDAFVAVQQQESLSAWRRFQDGWRNLWLGSLRMSQYDQQQLIYDPLRAVVTESWNAVRNAWVERQPWQWLRPLASPREWFSWRGGLAVFLLLLTASGLAALLRRGLARAAARRRQEQAGMAHTTVVPFFARLEKLLQRYGLQRDPPQTPREFAAALTCAAPASLPAEMPAAAQEMTEAFYAVRYGARTLSAAEQERMARRLEAWEQSPVSSDDRASR